MYTYIYILAGATMPPPIAIEPFPPLRSTGEAERREGKTKPARREREREGDIDWPLHAVKYDTTLATASADFDANGTEPRARAGSTFSGREIFTRGLAARLCCMQRRQSV